MHSSNIYYTNKFAFILTLAIGGCAKFHKTESPMAFLFIMSNLKERTKKFMDKATLVHKSKYDYSKVNYVNTDTKVEIICPIHGSFWQTPHDHLSGHGCPMCNGGKLLTTEDFIKRATKVHNGFYDYSKVKYTGNNKKIIIICPIHGEFSQEANSHLQKHGCPSCFKNKLSNKERYNTDTFVKLANEVHHNKYDYSKTIYERSTKKVTIICPEHGEFRQTPSHHLSGRGCHKCGGCFKHTTTTFINKAMKVHCGKYSYNKVNYTNVNSIITITCPKHGDFKQRAGSHLMGEGCPRCRYSRGENKIEQYLTKHKLKYTGQYKIPACRHKKPLPFDFAVFNEDGSLKCLIEYQGIQHFKPIKHFGGINGLLDIQLKDKIKKTYCEDNSITLICINNLEEVYKKLNTILNETDKFIED